MRIRPRQETSEHPLSPKDIGSLRQTLVSCLRGTATREEIGTAALLAGALEHVLCRAEGLLRSGKTRECRASMVDGQPVVFGVTSNIGLYGDDEQDATVVVRQFCWAAAGSTARDDFPLVRQSLEFDPCARESAISGLHGAAERAVSNEQSAVIARWLEEAEAGATRLEWAR